MNNSVSTLEVIAPQTFRFYRQAVTSLLSAKVPFLVGGAYALAHYTGIERHTKDFDLFVREADVDTALAVLRDAGFRSEVVFAHWLAKAYHGDDFVDVIYNSGNAVCPVDDRWFEHAPAAQILGVEVQLAPAEEMIWQKSYIMERERFDGADVNHLLRACGPGLDWNRLLARYGPHWRVLLAHLILFGFVYPEEADRIPATVVKELVARLDREPPSPPNGRLCRGPLLSRMQYLADTEEWGYTDARLKPLGDMTEQEIKLWTDAGR